ncbi:unnamed protein product [Chondrus crispus]|uniref:Uncharacterized protein n=1 Tax=Chondrus crispus TaxID=2769 RepID=R7Q4E2_CHOCR|nr:unnamed protein product [Chondrus crispus]CDF32335.1 unnamed protein product [Chondrus crispus]|eukprot:XP_005712000.1 unnamed protein product [Chondrus crispus]
MYGYRKRVYVSRSQKAQSNRRRSAYTFQRRWYPGSLGPDIIVWRMSHHH